MGDQLVVMRFDETGKPGTDLPTDTVVRHLRELFDDDPELDLPMADGDIVELERTGSRAGLDGFVYVGSSGIQRVVIEFNDTSWDEPVEGFRQEIRRWLEALVALAAETDARLFDVADPDTTNLTTSRALDLLAPTIPPDA
ncbi:hypothetical protein O7635_22390 [Asanoa sp. WMMD1127]|uniref:hypothetical protein n=1 Tax=Asanoa sp. WMMD1127 TaxID=3016107 RepID=UPI002417E7F3|nr:hypothetical protein [Asanoa sp. WMMD1127]MDG4824608.1 hypothetical protein [Asanoa sp. WMMD1127]